MMNRVLITRIAIVCLVCLTSSLLWGRGGAGNGGTRGGAAGGAGGFRGGAGGHSGPAAAANGAPHPGGAPASHSGNPQGAPGGSGSQPSVGIHGAQGPAPGAAMGGNHVSNAPRGEVSHGGDLHREAVRGGEVHREAGRGGELHREGPHGGERRFEGPHGGPGVYRAEMMHSPGAHWNGYHQAYCGNHPVHLAHPGYYPSYYYHPWYHGPWGGHPWGWGWGFGPGVTFGLAGSGWGVSISNGWGYPAYYGPYGPYGYWGRPLGWGFGGWGLGTTVYTSGYYVYENPYYSPVIYPNVVYDYSHPIPVMARAPQATSSASLPGLPPPESPPILDNPTFDAARESFRRGDYQRALAGVDSAIRSSPSDAVMHEFRSLVLFALRDYRQSAAVAHSVLAVGPGWDYTTMSSLYPDPFVYSDQLRQLDDYVRQHPRAADAHFLLAYHNMINSRKEEAVAELQQVISLMPNDRLASELLAMVKGPPKSTPSPAPTPSPFTEPKETFDGTTTLLSNRPGPAPAGPATPPLDSVDKTLLPGTWSASRNDGSKFRLVLAEDGKFTWTFSPPNQNQKGEELTGNYTVDGPVLILERREGGALAGTAKFTGDEQMNFKLVGAPTEDTGLDFEKG